MDWRLSAAARADGHRLHVFDRLASTSTEALARARSGEAGPLWIATPHQTAGRGRRGNAWSFLPGNLAASVLWPSVGIAPERLPGLGFVAGLALHRAVQGCCADGPDEAGAAPGGALALKWPNDLMLGGAKCAGILLEAETLPGGRRALVVGFGVNLAQAPGGLPDGRRAAAVADTGIALAPETVLERLSGEMAALARLWDRGRNFTEIRGLWLARASGLGSPIAVQTGSERHEGIFHEIDEEGRLVITCPDGSHRTVTAGEVHFGSAATAA